MDDSASSSSVTYVYPQWLSCLLLLLAATGFLSNILVCITILKTKFLHDLTHYLILNLAVSDGLCCLMFGLEMFMDLLQYPSSDTSEAAQILYCHLIFGNYLFQSFAYVSAYNLVIISLERYVGIVLPLRYQQICTKGAIWRAILLAWTLGFCAYLVHLIGVQYNDFGGQMYTERCKLVHAWEWHFMPFVAGFIVPLVTMIWAYTRIIKALRQSAFNQNVSVQARESREATKRIVHLMMIVTIAYVILYIPTQPAYMFIVTVDLGTFELTPLGILLTDLVSKLPVLLNSVINPFIYAFKYKKFRKGVQKLVCQCASSTCSPNDVEHIGGNDSIPSLSFRLQQGNETVTSCT